MKFIKKDHVFMFLITMVVVGTVILFFYPQLVNYSYSYVDLASKKETVESKNLSLLQNENNILNKTEELKEIEESLEIKHSEAVEIKRNIREDDFEFDMPSFLISMEQQAKKDKVELNIEYGSISTTGGNSEMSGVDYSDGSDSSESDIDEKSLETDEELIVDDLDSPVSNEEKDSEDVDNSSTFSDEEISNGTVNIEGINVTVIPILIEGGYSNVRSYIKYLDEIGMIEPSSVILESEEKLVKGKIILNVFHGEVL